MTPKLNIENRNKTRTILKKKVEELKVRLSKEYEGSINSQVAVNRSEINDIGIIIFAFNDTQSPYKFVRTEPLFYFKEKNFDILLYGNDILPLPKGRGISRN